MAPQSTQRQAARFPTRSTPTISQPPTRRRPAGGSGKAARGCRALGAATAPAEPVRGLGGGAKPLLAFRKATSIWTRGKVCCLRGRLVASGPPVLFHNPPLDGFEGARRALGDLSRPVRSYIAEVRSGGGVGFAGLARQSKFHPLFLALCVAADFVRGLPVLAR